MNDIIDVARTLRSKRYPDASAVFAAGSLVRGEGTAHSDLDLVVVYPAFSSAYRESFRFQGYLAESFVHDPGTLGYFFSEVDRPSGIPVLPQMYLLAGEPHDEMIAGINVKMKIWDALQDSARVGRNGRDPPGESRLTGNLNAVRTCQFHDHLRAQDSALTGSVTIQ